MLSRFRSTSAFRIGTTFGAQIYSQLVTIGVQILLVPILLQAWGTERYGSWLLLAALPTYLSFADFGFTFITKNEMTIKVARGDREGALVTFQSTLALLSIVMAILAFVAAVLLPFVHLNSLFRLGPTSDGEAKVIIVLLSANFLLTQLLALAGAGIRAEGQPALEAALVASGRLLEGLATAAAAIGSGHLAFTAAAIVATRALFVTGAFAYLRRTSPWIVVGYGKSSLAEIRRLLPPSVAIMTTTLSQAFMLQGPVIILGLTANASAVVVFSTCRTLARLGTAAVNVLNLATVPEYSLLYGRGDIRKYNLLVSLVTLGCLGLCAVYVPALNIAAGFVLAHWTHGDVPLIQPFFLVLSIAVAFEMMWTGLYTPLAATSRHVRSSMAFLGVSVAALLACYPASRAAGLTGAAAALAVAHAVMVPVCLLSQRDRARPQRLVASEAAG